MDFKLEPPLWPAQTDAIISTGSMGDRYLEASNTQNGVTNPDEQRFIRLSTWSQGDAVSLFHHLPERKAFRDPTWNRPRAVWFTIDLQPSPRVDGDTPTPESIDDTVQYFTTGEPEAGNPGFGFKIDMVDGEPSLRGVTHDGDTEYLHDLEIPPTLPPDSGRIRMFAQIHVNADGVEFFVEDERVGRGGNSPSGTQGAERLFTASLENQTNDDSRRETAVHAKVVQG